GGGVAGLAGSSGVNSVHLNWEGRDRVDALIPWKSLLLKILCQMWKLVTPLDALATFRLPLNEGSRIQAVWKTHGVRDESAIKRSWKLLCQSAQKQANTLLRFEALEEQHADLAYAHESCKDVKACYKECKKELVAVQSAFTGQVGGVGGREERGKSTNFSQADRIKQLEEALKQSEADAHQLRIEKEHYAIEAGRGEMGRFLALLSAKASWMGFPLAVRMRMFKLSKATPNVDPVSSDTFMDAYEKLFDRRYPYVDIVARMYLLDPSGLQNIMPDETGPTLNGGPRDTPTASYA
nr:hypothetical protein [Tanacetum cinerariifolium]